MSFKSWNKTTLSDMMDIIGGGTPKTTVEEYWNGDINWISVKDFNGDSKYILDTEKTITKLGLDKSSTKLLEKDDIIISARGTVGALGMISKPMAFNQSCYGLRAKSHVNSDFLFYLLKNSIRILQNNTHGSVFSTITRNTFDTIEVVVPDIREQKAIADILSSLDDKVELNNQMNETLEEMAQALFKRWFVDFEFLNEEGQPYKSSGGEMIESELGLIPKGWTEVVLKDLCEVITKGTTPTTLKKQFVSKGINFIKAESITSTHYYEKNKFNYIDEETHILLKRSILQENDILLSIAGTIGKLALVTKDILPANTNQAIAIIRVNQAKVSLLYIYSYFLCNQHLSYVNSRTVQAVQANLSLGVIGDMRIVLPSKDILENFNKIIFPIFKLIEHNNQQNNHLMELRDTLLPKLMSGKIRVSDLC